ncbi:hypothetical protein PtA15_10A371 [Puccinia triticina]|uniref:Uncharacterized protein n=1 Tax=Puccinia triticina TaxID=208348 RepID=A0ABY7CX73_9BASI|nr:uncharacterized protein PtA15_10A371 [Puccinia triticina]WAQ88948.1 hypothetical protein PtA15_10A371 [Puccinia triticina]
MPPQYIENDIPRIEIEMVVKAMEQSLHTLEETNAPPSALGPTHHARPLPHHHFVAKATALDMIGHPAQHPSAANSEQLNLAIINYHWVAHQLGQVERPLTRPVWMAEFKADLRAMITESEDRILACFEAYLKDQLTESKDRISALKDQLTKTKKQLGSAIKAVDRPQSDLLWKVWYTKIDVRRRFLALAEEKQPLLQSCRAGEHTTLGTRANQRLIKSVRARADQLRTSLNAYNTRSLAFRTACPTQHAPPTIEYAELLSSLKRGNEEKRRIGWEVRWALRWATLQHIVIWDILRSISRVSDDAIDIPQDLQAFISHDCLGSLSNLNEKISSVIVLMHQRLISIGRLQVDWDSHIIEVFENTAQQTGDNSLLELWEQQIKKIVLLMKKTQLSGIPGYVWDETVFTEGTDEIGAENRASATRNTGSRASSINHAEERPQANDPSNSLPQNNDFHADEDDELGEDEYNDNIDHVVQSMEQSMLDNLVA